jgi:stage 0 sporulation regulatory protein
MFMFNLTMIIESKRNEMIFLAKTLGITAQETIQCSQELDRLLNFHQQGAKDMDKIRH